MIKLKLGDTVRLKSGGPVMTVMSLPEYGKHLHCAWFWKGQLQSGSFHPEALVKCKSKGD